MYLDTYLASMRPAIEVELHRVLEERFPTSQAELYQMLAYHLGWEGEGAGSDAQGKRIRPLLVLLSTAAAGEDWHKALPAAAAVELIHNFSLIHDDIQDQSPLRRGRPTVWVKWGIPQAINAGDVMFTLAHLAMVPMAQVLPLELTLKSIQMLDETCIQLTEGQYLDMAYEKSSMLPMDAYWPMVSGKTAALLSCCTELGALAAQADESKVEAFRKFGFSLGLAFQILDDWLGIWGNAALTGKSTESDLVSGKKTLPVLYALEKKARFSERWNEGRPVKPEEVVFLSKLLVEEGAQSYTQETADRLTQEARAALTQAAGDNQAAWALQELADLLLKRKN